METVHFISDEELYKRAEESFVRHQAFLQKLLPKADIQHIGSTAIPRSLTKGDLDIQVRVTAAEFPSAVTALAKHYGVNEGSTQTDTFRAFQDDRADPQLGIQLTVIDSELDFFWKIRDVLKLNDQFLQEYDDLKRKIWKPTEMLKVISLKS
ncbi:GrpB family protein [Allobacillus sp. GCM10007491]|uniref:GrpB family protein n=1 Tax=Allobacillus TaxID=1400133 RepID=UPI001F378E2B|nr:GrpB family protein [Allobacillus saliphilus]